MRLTTIATILLLVSAGRAQRGDIHGKITDASSGSPLVAANFSAASPELRAPTGAATDADGYYKIINLPSGTYTVTATYIGYESIARAITLGAGESLEANFALEPEAIQIETWVVTASRRRERIEDAPAAISVVTERTIRRESNTNLGDYLKLVKGVDFTQSGVDSYNLSARGFNTSFSSRLLTLTDGRMANVPSLRLIAYNVIPVSFEDVKQFEIVLGPSSALYGPNAHSGVLNIVTKEPRESVGTTFNIQLGSQSIRKLALRHASAFGPLGLKISAVSLSAQDWEHFNQDEFEGHDPAFIGRPYFRSDRVDNGGSSPEYNSPRFTAEMLTELMKGEIPHNGIDDNGNGWIDESLDWVDTAFADGFDNGFIFPDFESGSPLISAEMIVGETAGNGLDDNGNGLIDETEADIGQAYADGIDNNGDGFIDEGIDSGMDADDRNETWYDGIDNDGDGDTDEADEVGDAWLNRFENYGPNGFGDYIYDQDGNMSFDTNQNGIYGDDWGRDGVDNDRDGDIDEADEGDVHLNFGDLPRWSKDANADGINDWPVFDVKNLRYDIRMDYVPSQDFSLNFSHGYARARNINITGIARYLADGFIYRYYHGRLRYKNFFAQAYLNASFSGKSRSPTRNLATGEPIFDRSKKFSAQFQHSLQSQNERLRFVWGMDYFLTLPDTRGTILSDRDRFDLRDNNGNGEAGSPISFADDNGNLRYDPGEGFNSWATDNTRQGGTPADVDTVWRAIRDGIDNDGDGLIDEGIDEAAEDNRFVVNELGTYYQFNFELSPKLELIQATRFDAHDRLTDLVDFDNQTKNYSPLNWKFDFNATDGVQISPKFGLIYKPAPQQNLRLTWARAYNTPSNQALFLDIFVTRAAIFKVYARGASGGYVFPRTETDQIYYYDIKQFDFAAADTSSQIYFYLSVDPRIEGYFKDKVPDLPEIEAEIVNTWEVGYKGRLLPSLHGTLDLYASHYSSFISPVTFITPLVLDRKALTTDYDGDGIRNTDPENIVDQEDYEEALRLWQDHLAGVGALGSIDDVPSVVVGYLNYGEVNLYGLDMSLTWFLSRSISLDLNYSFISISEFLNPVTGAQDPINAPRHKGGLKIQYNPRNDKTSLALSYRYVDGFLWSSGIYFGPIETYGVADFHGSYRFNPHLAGMISINNIFGNRHVEIIGGPALGRSAMIRLQATL